MTSDTKSANGGQPSNVKLKWTAPRTTPEQVLREGEEAARLLESPIFSLAFNSMFQSIQDDWAFANPEETKRKEWLHLKIRSMGEIAAELRQFINAAKSVEADQLRQEQIRQMEEDEERRAMASRSQGYN